MPTQLHKLARNNLETQVGWRINEAPESAVSYTMELSQDGTTWHPTVETIYISYSIPGFMSLRATASSLSQLNVDISKPHYARVKAFNLSGGLVETIGPRNMGEDQIDWSTLPHNALAPEVQFLEDAFGPIVVGTWVKGAASDTLGTNIYVSHTSTGPYELLGRTKSSSFYGKQWKVLEVTDSMLNLHGLAIADDHLYFASTIVYDDNSESPMSSYAIRVDRPNEFDGGLKTEALYRGEGKAVVGFKRASGVFPVSYKVYLSTDGLAFSEWKTVTPNAQDSGDFKGYDHLEISDGDTMTLGLTVYSKFEVKMVPQYVSGTPLVTDVQYAYFYPFASQLPAANTTRAFCPYLRSSRIFQLVWTPVLTAAYYDVYLSWQDDQLNPPLNFVPAWTFYKRVTAHHELGLQLVDVTNQLLAEVGTPGLQHSVADKWWGKAIPVDINGVQFGSAEMTDEAWPVYGGEHRLENGTWFKDDMSASVHTRTYTSIGIGFPPHAGEIASVNIYLAPVQGPQPLDLRKVLSNVPNIPQQDTAPDYYGWGEWVQAKITQDDVDAVFGTGPDRVLIWKDLYLDIIPVTTEGKETTFDSPALLYIQQGVMEYQYKNTPDHYHGII